MFDSHPGMQARLERIARAIDRGRLTATATAEARYGQTITYTPVPQTELATVEAGTRGLAGGNAKAEPEEGEAGAAAGQQKDAPKKRRGFGLSNLAKGGGDEGKSAQVVGSGGARGLDPEKDARGGSNPAPVIVKVSQADLEAFRAALK